MSYTYLITGATSDVGRALIERLLQNAPADTLVLAQGCGDLEKLADLCARFPGQVRPFDVDLSDRAKEVRWHTALAVTLGAAGLLLTTYFLGQKNATGVVVSLAIAAAGTMGAIPIFWQIPNRFLSGMALVVGLAVINSIANLAGYFSPQLLGYLKTNTGAYASGLMLIALVELIAPVLILLCISREKGQTALKP